MKTENRAAHSNEVFLELNYLKLQQVDKNCHTSKQRSLIFRTYYQRFFQFTVKINYSLLLAYTTDCLTQLIQ